MDWKRRRASIRARLLLQQNASALVFVALWFAANWAVFSYALGHGARNALMIVFYFRQGPGAWGAFYQTFSDFVVFGLLISVVVGNLHRRYRPEETCRLLAAESRDHVVVVGLSHLGQRVVELVEQRGRRAVVIEDDRAKTEGLVRDERPLVIGAGRDVADFTAAATERAAVVVVASDDLESTAIACKLVRQLNRDCALLFRCDDDEVGEVLARTYDARAVCPARMAARHVADTAARAGTRTCVVVGHGDVGRRVTAALTERGVRCTVTDEHEDALATLPRGVDGVHGAATDLAVLERAGVRSAELVVVTEDALGRDLVVVDRVRELNPGCRVVCRVFHDAAASLLEQRPFNCEAISTSRHTVLALAREGAFHRAGI